MARIPDKDLEAIRAKADIVSVIGSYIKLEGRGNDYVGVCPFHQDHSPSLHVNPEKGIYKCFVCGNGGDVFKFVQEYEHITFVEAVKKVADKVGYKLLVNTDSEKPVDPRKKAIYDCLEETSRYTEYELSTHDGEKALKYLESRGLNAEIRKKFNIGYNPGGNALLKFLQAKKHSEEIMVASDVCRLKPAGISDSFYERITFPIHDANGKVAGFSSRIYLEGDDRPKYLNTKETEVFKKGELVYNYHRAKLSARKLDKVYVCEGVTDVIAFAKAGVENAVCTLGTSCTDSQIRLISGLTKNIVFCYDGDDAGQRATWKAARKANEIGCHVSVIWNETGKDPDELVTENLQKFTGILTNNELPWMEFVIKSLEKHNDLSSYAGKKKFVETAMQEVSKLPKMDRDYFTKKVSKISGLNVEAETRAASAEADEEVLLVEMLKSIKPLVFMPEITDYIKSSTNAFLAEAIVKYYEVEDVSPTYEALEPYLKSQKVKELTKKLMEQPSYKEPYSSKKVLSAVEKILVFRSWTAAKTFEKATAGLTDEETERALVRQYSNALNRLGRLSVAAKKGKAFIE